MRRKRATTERASIVILTCYLRSHDAPKYVPVLHKYFTGPKRDMEAAEAAYALADQYDVVGVRDEDQPSSIETLIEDDGGYDEKGTS